MKSNPPAPDDPPAALLLTVKQVAALLSLGQRTIWKMSAAGRMPAPLRVGRAVRWRRDELMTWIRGDCATERLEASGRLGPCRIELGRAFRFRADEVTAWIAAGCPDRAVWHARWKAGAP